MKYNIPITKVMEQARAFAAMRMKSGREGQALYESFIAETPSMLMGRLAKSAFAEMLFVMMPHVTECNIDEMCGFEGFPVGFDVTIPRASEFSPQEQTMLKYRMTDFIAVTLLSLWEDTAELGSTVASRLAARAESDLLCLLRNRNHPFVAG